MWNYLVCCSSSAVVLLWNQCSKPHVIYRTNVHCLSMYLDDNTCWKIVQLCCNYKHKVNIIFWQGNSIYTITKWLSKNNWLLLWKKYYALNKQISLRLFKLKSQSCWKFEKKAIKQFRRTFKRRSYHRQMIRLKHKGFLGYFRNTLFNLFTEQIGQRIKICHERSVIFDRDLKENSGMNCHWVFCYSDLLRI